MGRIQTIIVNHPIQGRNNEANINMSLVSFLLKMKEDMRVASETFSKEKQSKKSYKNFA